MESLTGTQELLLIAGIRSGDAKRDVLKAIVHTRSGMIIISGSIYLVPLMGE